MQLRTRGNVHSHEMANVKRKNIRYICPEVELETCVVDMIHWLKSHQQKSEFGPATPIITCRFLLGTLFLPILN